MSRMAPLERLLKLLDKLTDPEGMTLDQMAESAGVSRRTAERMRDVIMLHFDLEDVEGERPKRWRIAGKLGRMFTCPTAEELSALTAQAEACRVAGQHGRADLLSSLFSKIKGALDLRARSRTAPDVEALSKVQRILVPAGPGAIIPIETLSAVQGAIMAGVMLEFNYRAEGKSEAGWRRVIPYGLLHGAVSYLVGAIPQREHGPALYRLDRMEDVRESDCIGVIPNDFDLDDWAAESFGVWRDGVHEIMLRILPHAADRAANWRFHPRQKVESQSDGGAIVVFSAGGMRELAEHIFTWGDGIEVLGPDLLRDELRAMLEEAIAHHAPPGPKAD